jgi:acyl CoA:acetate/3-ketoacid CoA transferase alpha subunit
MEELETGLGELLLYPDMNEFREWMHKNKSMTLKDKVMGEAEAVRTFIQEGKYIATELYGSVRAPMSLCREIVRQGFKSLNIAGQGVMETEHLISGGCVKKIELTYQGWEVYGISNILRRAAESGQVTISEWSNASLAWRLKAAAMGIPFIPTRSMLGTDTFKHSAAKVIKCPFTGQKLVALPASVVDVGIIHVHRADKYGNCQIDGITGFAWELARASRRLIISCEEVVPTDDIRRQPDRTIIPWFLVDAVVHAPYGSYPGEMCYYYERDKPHIEEYIKMTETAEGTKEYLDKWIYGPGSHAEFLELVGAEKLETLKKAVLGR